MTTKNARLTQDETIASPEDVAFELVATKVAVLGLIETLVGTSPIDPTAAAVSWAYQTPVHLAFGTEDFEHRLYERSSAIENDMLRGIASFVAAKVEKCGTAGGDDA